MSKEKDVPVLQTLLLLPLGSFYFFLRFRFFLPWGSASVNEIDSRRFLLAARICEDNEIVCLAWASLPDAAEAVSN